MDCTLLYALQYGQKERIKYMIRW